MPSAPDTIVTIRDGMNCAINMAYTSWLKPISNHMASSTPSILSQVNLSLESNYLSATSIM